MADLAKHLERAKKYLEKNKLQDAIGEYEAVLEISPNSQEIIQTLGDLHARLGKTERAATYYGMLFDRLAESRDATRAVALYTRFLKAVPQPPDRVARFAHLLQKQNKRDDAMQTYESAAELYLAQNNSTESLVCLEKIAQLDPDNPARHIKLGEVGERFGQSEMASRGYLRAGQIALAAGELDRAIEMLSNAHRLASADRSVALCYAETVLRQGDAARAIKLLQPFEGAEADHHFLQVFGESLTRAGQLEKAGTVLEQLYQEKPDHYEKLFDLAGAFIQAGTDEKAAEVLKRVKDKMFAAKQQNVFAAQADAVFAANPNSIPLAEFCGRMYEELNRETKYFDVLQRLFDLYMAKGDIRGACDAVDRLVDIDPYDFGNQKRMVQLEGKADPAYLRSLSSRVAKAATVGGQAPMMGPGIDSVAAGHGAPPMRPEQALDDLLVQVEIFLQYALREKALERLQKVAEMFPGAEETNERLAKLCQQANWWPAGSRGPRPPEAAKPEAPARAAAATGMTGVFNADTLRDLAKISEITRTLYRQSTPKGVLSVAVNEIGSYLRVTRCAAVMGPPGQPPQMAAEYCAPGSEGSKPQHILQLIAALQQMPPDSLGAMQVDASAAPVLREMALDSALGVPFTDKETQAAAGTLLVGSAMSRKWKQNESYFLQAISDQVLLTVNHTKLQSLMRTMAVADAKTGLLSRSSYLDCLVAETNRAKAQSTSLSLAILQVDRGFELHKQQGEALFERYMEQLGRTLQSNVRQSDLAVKYTAWALAFILPDTPLAAANSLAEKLRKAAQGVKPPAAAGNQTGLTLSATVVEALSRPDYESEDIVTDLINRAETGLEEARKKGGDTTVSI